MTLLMITLGCMALTIGVKWFSVTSQEHKRSDLQEAMEVHGHAKYRLKNAVKEVTMATSDIEKLKRKINRTETKVKRLQADYAKYNEKAQQSAAIQAEKMRLADELQKRKGGMV